jgi:uncharacterized protein with PQ loop repeat
MNPSLVHALTTLYSFSGLLVAVFYLPQLRAVWRSSTDARDVSLCTWVCWTLAALVATLYSAIVARDGAFLAVSTANLAGCAGVTAVVVRKRRRVNTRPSLAAAREFRR